MSKNAVDAPRRNYFMMDPHDVVIVGLDTKDGKEHHLYDDRIHLPVDPDMVANIRAYGVIKAVRATKDGDRVLIVDGRQRARACRLAWDLAIKAGEEPPRLPVDMMRGTEVYTFGVSRAGNGFTQAETPLQRAENAQRMLAMGASPEHVAVTFGVKKAQIDEWVSLLGLAAPIRKAIDAGEVSPSAGAKLAKLPKDEQVQQLAQLREQGVKPTTRAVANKVRVSKGKSASRTPLERIEATTKVLLELQKAGAIPPPVLDKLSKALHGKALADVAKGDGK